MKVLLAQQGSENWVIDRLGIATASCFDKIMTSKQLKRSKNSYIYELAAEAIAKESQSTFAGNSHTERGHELEPEAIAYYEFINSVECQIVGLCLAYDGAKYGMSPDALIGDDGGLEVKSPELKKHIEYVCGGVVPDEYLHQVYGCLYISQREWWDFMSYNEMATPFVVRTSKDDVDYIKWKSAFEIVLHEFLSDLENIIKKIKA